MLVKDAALALLSLSAEGCRHEGCPDTLALTSAQNVSMNDDIDNFTNDAFLINLFLFENDL